MRSRRWVVFIVGLLALNLVLSFGTGGPPSRERVPYQPFFVAQVEAGNVKEISSQGDSIEGELNREMRYDPPGDAKPVAGASAVHGVREHPEEDVVQILVAGWL